MTDPRASLRAIARGMRLAKCRRCGCMAQALQAAPRVQDHAAAARIAAYRAQMEPIAYPCFGCRRCWGAEAQNALAPAAVPVAPRDRCQATPAADWPAAAGEYVLGNQRATVAVCTLGSEELVEPVMQTAGEHIAIAGKCETENIGVEKVVLNIISNPRLRTLILCGKDPRGHRPGDALRRLEERGVDPDLRVLDSAAARPVLPNLNLAQVARFRRQVQLLDRIGETSATAIATLARERDALRLPALPGDGCQVAVPRLIARPPQRLSLDPAGFFVIIPDPRRGVIVCEHYFNNGRLAHVVEGRQAALIAATLIEEGWLTRLDHAAYLGRELCRAQHALDHGLRYVQDGASGDLAPSDPEAQGARDEATASPNSVRGGCRGGAGSAERR